MTVRACDDKGTWPLQAIVGFGLSTMIKLLSVVCGTLESMQKDQMIPSLLAVDLHSKCLAHGLQT